MKKLSVWGKLAQRWVQKSRGRVRENRWFGYFLFAMAIFYFLTSSFVFAVANLFLAFTFFVSSGFVELIQNERESQNATECQSDDC